MGPRRAVNLPSAGTSGAAIAMPSITGGIDMVAALIVFITALSGLADAQACMYASRIWQAGEIHWVEVLKSAAGFQVGMALYFFVLRLLTTQGVVAVEVQTLLWFGTTILGVAVLSGRFLHWPLFDQCAALMVVGGMALLLLRAPGSETVAQGAPAIGVSAGLGPGAL